MIHRALFYLALALATYVASLKWLHGFKYDDFKDYLTLISGASGMVFTIMGIWIAFLYPNAMARIVNPSTVVAKDFSESKSEAKRLESIVGAVMCSALVMMIALLITLVKMVLVALPFYAEHRIEIKSASLAVLIFITLIQFEAVVNVVISNVLFINDLHFKRQGREADDEL